MDVDRVDMVAMNTGVCSTHCSDMLTTKVTNCTIYATRRGIDFFLNPGTGGMTASYNNIFVTGKKAIGIAMQEGGANVNTPYFANCNYVDNVDGIAGIYANYLWRPAISNNTVTFSNPGNFTDLVGISLTASSYANVVSNHVKSNSVAAADTNKWGMFISISDYSNINCNTVDSTGWGVYFDGSCLGSNFRGNTMNQHYEGLHLNKVAVVDTQTHAGNRWMATTYGSGYGAVNWNYFPQANLFKSLFYVQLSLGITYFPNIPGYNAGWFQDIPGAPYSCPSTLPCYNPDFHGDDGSGGLRMLIAEDSTLSAEFIDETKSIAKMQLYGQIKTDSTAYAGDSLMMQFKNTSNSNAIGQLYAVQEKMNTVSTFDTVSLFLIYQTDSLLELLNKNLNELDSIATSDTSIDYSIQRTNLINELSGLHQTRATLISQHHFISQDNVTEAITLNASITPTQLPEENGKFMNDISVKYYLYGIDSIANFYSQILEISMQCPDAGGKAVYRARPYVELFNDSVEYDDVNACHLAGIYRESLSLHEQENGDIQINPNPASDKIDVVLNHTLIGICKIEISNALGAVVLKDEMNCKEITHSIDIHKFVSGIYVVKVYHNTSALKIVKLVIER